MKYVAIRYAGKGRLYTYLCDDDTVAVGDEVQFTTRHGSTMTAEVEEVSENDPGFACNPCIKVAM